MTVFGLRLSPSGARWLRLALLPLILGGLVFSIDYVVRVLPYHFYDFENYYAAVRLIWRGVSPYGQVEFFAPPWFALLLAPLFMPSLPVAAIYWLLLHVTALSLTAYLSLEMFDVRSHRGRLIWLLVVVALPSALFGYMVGQVSPLVGLAALLGAWILLRRPDAPVALMVACFLFASLKPHIVAVTMLLCGLELLRRRQWRTLGWLAAAGVALILLAFANNPAWLSDIISAWREGDFRGGKPGLIALGYIGLTELGIPLWLWWPFLAYLLYRWWRDGLTNTVVALSFALNLLVVPYNRMYDYVSLVFPLLAMLVLAPARTRWLWYGLAVGLIFLPLTPVKILTPVVLLLGLLVMDMQVKATKNTPIF